MRRDMRDELEVEAAEDDSGGAVAEHEANGETLVPEPSSSPSPVAASRARPAVFRSEGRVGRVGSDTISVGNDFAVRAAMVREHDTARECRLACAIEHGRRARHPDSGIRATSRSRAHQ